MGPPTSMWSLRVTEGRGERRGSWMPPLKKKGGGVGRDRGSTVQIRAHSDSYLHAFRLCEHLHVQEKKKSRRGREWVRGRGAACGGNVRREGTATTAVHPRGLACVCATCVSRPRYLVRGGPTGIGRRNRKGAHVAAVLRHGSKFVSDYRTRPGILAEQAVDPV